MQRFIQERSSFVFVRRVRKTCCGRPSETGSWRVGSSGASIPSTGTSSISYAWMRGSSSKLTEATHSTDREIRQDEQRTRVVLETCGYHVIRFANAEIYDNRAGVMETILAELEKRVHL